VNSPEIACSASTSGGATSGGGFSMFSALPTWQSSQVSSYLLSAIQSSTPPKSGYSLNRRGYPGKRESIQKL
jgi:hypothetical protein